MPGMPRVSKLTTKIAYKIMGVPANMIQHKTKEQKYVNKRLNFEETQRVR